MDEPRLKLLRFGKFELDLEREELREGGAAVKLNAQPARLLALLVTHAGELVSREEIRRKIWGDDTFVNFEQGINHCIRQIRSALADDADSPRFIQTVSRRGYRFLMQVEAWSGVEAGRPTPSPRRRAFGRVPKAVALGTIAIGLGAWILLILASSSQRSQPKTSSHPKRPTLAILPFENLEDRSKETRTGESFTEDLITEVGRRYSGRLGVIAGTSAMIYRGSTKSLAEIARELGASYVLEGRVRRSGSRVRVTARLVRAADQIQMWAGEYDREVTDAVGIQRDVGGKIAQALALKILAEKDRLLPAAGTSSEAYDYYLKGRYFLSQNAPESADLSRASFQKAIKLDPGFAPAYVGLANAHSHRMALPRQFMPDAREAVLKALALDDSLAEAHLVLAQLMFYYDLDPEGARREFERALEINPAYSEAHHQFAAYFSATGQQGEALAEVLRARSVDPLAPMVNSDVGWYHYFARRYDDAIRHSRRTLELTPDFYWARRCILLSLVKKNDLHAAAVEARDEMEEAGAPREQVRSLGELSPSDAMRTYWLWDLNRKLPGRPRRPRTDLAVAYVGLGKRDLAVAALEEAFEERYGWQLLFLGVEPMMDSLRGDPRFEDLVHRIGARSSLTARR